jgi:mono/diheme cytochrome c family protein
VAHGAPSLGYKRFSKTGPLVCALLWLLVVSLVMIVNAVRAETFVLVDKQGRPRASLHVHDGQPQLTLLTPDGHPGSDSWTVQKKSLPAAEARPRSPATDRRDRQELRGRRAGRRINSATVQLFGQHCATCHGGDGRGAESRADFPAIPNFVDSSWQRSRSDAQLTASIINGRGDNMPPFSDDLTRTQVSALIVHIRWLAPESVNSPARRTSEFARKYAQLKQEWDMLARELAALQSRE